MEQFDHSDIIAKFPHAVQIGQGSQKVVYEVNHKKYGIVVIKIGKCSTRNMLERIRREVEVLKGLTSNYYPNCFEFVLFEDNRFYIVEEKLNGLPLTNYLKGVFSVAEIISIISELVSALSILWDINVIHRDVKPANILIDDDYNIWIIDLGIARLLDKDSLTRDILAMGPCTPVYASLEQLTNSKVKINHRSDQFSLGIIFAQLILNGIHPFDPEILGSGDSIVDNIQTGNWMQSQVLAKSNINIYNIICKMLGKQPHQRFRIPELLVESLNNLKE